MAQPTDPEKGGSQAAPGFLTSTFTGFTRLSRRNQTRQDDHNEQTHDQSPPPRSPAPAPERPEPPPAAPAAPAATPSSAKKKSNFGDSSGPLFSLYSEIADEEDDEMAAQWQQDAKDILIFTGLFSAAVSVLLAVSVLDLKPSSQDISAVYLANIYQVLAHADLNITLPPTSIPPIPSSEPFSPPKSAIWVNSLWFLSLVINLTCALLATSLHQWSRRYNRFTHPSRCGPEKRARLRAFFWRGMDKMHLPSTVEALPALIHLSLFLFFAGLAVYLFNINHNVFISVVWWILGFTAIYGWMTLMPIFRHDSPYYSPLSSTAWTLHAIVSYTLFRVLAFITFRSNRIRQDFRDLSERYRDRISSHGHVQKVAEETTSTQSSELDLEILDYTIGSAVGDDESLEDFFEAIPGFFKSPLVKDLKGSLCEKPEVRSRIVESLEGFMERNLSSNAVSEEINTRRLVICMNATKEIGESGDIYRILSSLSQGTLGEDDNLLEKLFDINHGFLESIPKEDIEREKRNPRLRHALDGLLCRTLSANTVAELVKTRRLGVYLNAIKVIYGDEDVNDALFEILGGEFGQLPASMEIAYALKPWCADQNIPHMVRIAPTWFADTLIRTPPRKRDKPWIAFVQDQFDSSDGDLSSETLQDYINDKDNNNTVLLAIFNHVARQVIRTESWGWDMDILSPLSKFDIRDTQPKLQNDFCDIWNQIVKMARDMDPDYCFYVLRCIRQLYIALHQDTVAPPTAFNASTKDKDDILSRPSSYPFCKLAEHHPHPPVPHPTQPIPGSSVAPQQAEEAHVISELPAQEFVQTFGPDLNRLVSNLETLVSLLSSQSSLSTANLTTKIRPNDEPTPDISIKHPQVDPVPVTVTPSVIAYPPSVSVEQQDAHKREDTTVSHARSDITLVSSDATEIPPSISIASVTPQASEELTGVPPTTVSDPQSSLIVALPSSGSVIPTEPPPSVESTLVQLDPLSHPFGSLPSTSTITRDPDPPAPMEASALATERNESSERA